MPSQIRVTVAGDAAPLNVAMGSATRTLQKFGGDAEVAAKAVVSASQQQIEALTLMAAEYKKLATSSAASAEEQATASKLAADAQKQLAASMAVVQGESKKTSASVGALGKAMSAAFAGFAIKEVVGGLVGASEKFQQSMELIHTQAGATQTEVNNMSKALMQMAASVGTTPDTLAQGLYHIESAGLRGAKALQALRIAAEGAKIGGADLEDVTNALNAVIVSGIKGSEDFSAAMGSLNATVGAGDMRMQDLAEAMGTGLPAKAKTYGVSLRDVNAALAVFGDNNIRGAEAGTQLASALRLMAAPSKESAKVLAAIGLSSTQLAHDLRNGGLPVAIQDLKKHMDDLGLSAEQQGEVLTRAFGGRQAGGILILMDQMERLKTKEKEVGDGANNFATAWAATQKTAAFSMDRFQSSMSLLEITIGNKLLPIVAELANKFSDWVTKASTMDAINKTIDQITSAVKDMVPYLQTAAKWSDTVAQALGGWTTVIKELIVTFAALKVAVAAATLVMDFNPIIAAATALALTAGYVVTHWEQVKGWFQDFEAWAKKWAAVIGEVIFGPYGAAAGEVIKHWEAVKAWFADFVGDLQQILSHPLAGLENTFKDLGTGLADGLKAGIKDFVDAVSSIQIHIKTWHGLPDGISIKWSGGSGSSSGGVSVDGSAPTDAQNNGQGANRSGVSGGQTTNMAAGKAKLLALAQDALGTPYLWGGNSPGGFDCSGLVQWAFANGLNVNIPRTTYGQSAVGQQVSASAAKIGDVVFTNYGEGGKAGPGHEGLIVGFKNGQPIIEAAPHTGSKVQTYQGYNAFTGGGAFTVRDLLAKAGPNALTGSVGGGNPAFNLDAGSGSTKKAPTYKIPDALAAKIKAAEGAFENSVTKQHLDALTAILSKEESLLKAHGEQAAAQQVANEIAAAKKKYVDQLASSLKADTSAATEAAAKALSAFGSGDNSAAVKALDAQAADLKKAEDDLRALIANSSGKQKAAYEAQLTRIKTELDQVEKDKSIPEVIADAISKFVTELRALTNQAKLLANQRSATADLQAVGYFGATQDQLQAIDQSILGNLQSQLSVLQGEQAKLKQSLKGADANMKAAVQAKLKGITGSISTLTGEISQAMGQVGQDLQTALQSAQGAFNSAVSNLQDDLDGQLQKLAEDSTGYTADNAQLQSMQAADTLQGYNDAITSATKQLQDDQKAGADKDTLAADQKALDMANRQLQEYQLQIKAQGEQAQASADAAAKQKALNTQLSGYEQELLSGKITAAQFTDDLAALSSQYGVSIDTTGAEFLAVQTAAGGVVTAFNALIAWVNKTTGSNIPTVAGAQNIAAANALGGANPGGAGTTDTSTGNARTPGLQMASGGIVPRALLHAFGGAIVPGLPKAMDYVPAALNGGEMIFNGAQQRNLFNLVAAGGMRFGQTQQPPMMPSGGSNGVHITLNAPNFYGDKAALIQMLRTEFGRLQLRGSAVY